MRVGTLDALIPASAALLGALIGSLGASRAARESAVAASAVARADRIEEIRRQAASAVADAQYAAEWLDELRVEDSTLEPWRAERSPEYIRRAERLRRGRDSLNVVAAMSGELAEPAGACAMQRDCRALR